MPEDNKVSYRIFISYRHEDNPDVAHHLYSWFVWHYERHNVFMDFESISSGAEFAETITDEVKNCDALVAVIGPEWMRLMGKLALAKKKDYVRQEIGLALAEKKLVVPLRIQGAELPKADELPKDCRALLHHHASVVESGAGFIDSINRILNSIDRILATSMARRKEAESLDAVSPASGLALGYYVNFLKPVLHSLTAINPNSPTEYLSHIEITERGPAGEAFYEFGKPVGSRTNLSLRVVIPHRIELVQSRSMAEVKKVLKQATIRLPGSPRPFILDARQTEAGYELVDFPNTIAVLENWIQRRLKQESLKPDSDAARQLEHEELARFERMLKWWAEDELLDPEFKGRVQITRFSSDIAELKWLAEIWKS